MKITKQRVNAIRKVIRENRLVKNRVDILTNRGYVIKKTRCELSGVGKVFAYPTESKVQIASGDAYGGALCAIFDPESHQRIGELNKK